MRTDELIEALARDLEPVAYRAPLQRIILPMLLGGAGSLIMLLSLLGVRPDLRDAVLTPNFWIKLGAMLAMLFAAFAAVDEVARPESSGRRAAKYVWLVVALGLVGAAAQLARLAPGEIASAWLGRGSAILCPIRIMILSAPAFAGIVWGFRKLAPTNLHSAGLFAGLLAGAVGAAAYSLFCRSYSPVYILTWYGLGVSTVAAIGFTLGPRILRW